MRCTKIYLFLLIFTLLSCDKKAVTEEPGGGLVIIPSNLIVNIDAGTNSIFYTIKSSKQIKVVSDNPSWCSSILSNVSLDNLRIIVSENKSSSNRTATIIVSDGSEDIRITINQEGFQPLISVNKNSVIVQYGIQEFSLEIISNVQIGFELPEWITEKENNVWEQGRQKYNFSLSALPNELFERSGTITIKAIDESLTMQPVLVSVVQKAPTKIIAHRGYWRIPDFPQNSLASLQRALDLGIYGSELDVWITADGVVVLNHDPTINGINLENSVYQDLKHIRLSNGESIPLLEDCIKIVKSGEGTKLIIEIKPHSNTVNENRAVDAVLEIVEKNNAKNLVDYISFSQNICRKLIAENPKNRVAYLNGNIAPTMLKEQGYWGLDYSSGVLKANTNWVMSAKNLELTTNVWTVNSTADFEYFITMGVDFITTDAPQDLKDILLSRK